MKIAGLFLCGLMAGGRLSAAEAQVQEKPPEEVAPSVPELVAGLSSDDFKVREDATRKLWAMGEAVLEPLRTLAAGEEPEAAFRAQGLVRNIEHHITPDTDPAVILLVERYMKAEREDKAGILTQIRARRGWHQLLKLYEHEKDPKIREERLADVHEVAIVAAREKLLDGKPDEARKFLEMAPRDAEGLMALAVFCRSQGTLNVELERAKKAPDSAAWRLALYRAAGDTQQARKVAEEAGEGQLAAAMALFEGDPLPWFARKQSAELPPTEAQYLDIVTALWKGRPITPAAIEPLVKALNSRDEDRRAAAGHTLFLLGESAIAEPWYLKSSPLNAVMYFEAMERISEAFAALGIDPKNPDFKEWAEKRFDRVISEEDDSAQAAADLIQLAELAGKLGSYPELIAAFEKPLLKMAAENEEAFTVFLSRLFGSDGNGRIAEPLAREIGMKWAGEDAGRWRSLIRTAFEEDDTAMEWWDWTAVLKPDAGLPERFDGMLAILGISPDPKQEGAVWLDLAWKAVEQAAEAQRPALLKRLYFIGNPESGPSRQGDAATFLKVWDMLKPEERDQQMQSAAINNLAIARRWEEAAAIFEKQLEDLKEAGQITGQPFCHARAAASLRRAGKEKEAAAHDEWVEKLSLGDCATSLKNSQGYAYGGDEGRALLWLARAAVEASPQMEQYEVVLNIYAERLLEDGKWKPAAALGEAVALWTSTGDLPPVGLLQLRMRVDLPYALSILGTDRPRAVALLARCHKYFPSGGSLADSFYPAVRTAGLTKEHAKWFEESWKVFADLIAAYPESHHLRNGCGWLAGRACLRLEEADKLMREGLALIPEQAAYLDTMAEIQFARRDRKAALKWSAKAINFATGDTPNEAAIRRQYERFSDAPFP
jgi:tetratricopeptide (TPR) repeat protein